MRPAQRPAPGLAGSQPRQVAAQRRHLLVQPLDLPKACLDRLAARNTQLGRIQALLPSAVPSLGTTGMP
jgi:hypothetical protein